MLPTINNEKQSDYFTIPVKDVEWTRDEKLVVTWPMPLSHDKWTKDMDSGGEWIISVS